MKTHIVEVTNNDLNWGKLMVCVHDAAEMSYQSQMSPSKFGTPLLRQIGYAGDEVWVLDLQTGEGARFRPGGLAAADLDKHRVWVCPMFQPFLEWLYANQDLIKNWTLPATVNLPHADFDFRGYRRPGPPEAQECPTPSACSESSTDGSSSGAGSTKPAKSSGRHRKKRSRSPT